MKENKARNLVLINIRYVEYFEFVKVRVSMCTWWRMSKLSYGDRKGVVNEKRKWMPK